MTDAEQRDMAILLAARVMGWPLRESGDYSDVYPFIWLDGSRLLVERDPHRLDPENWNPAANVAQAFECLGAMRERGWSVRLDFVPDRLRTAEMPERYVCLMMWRGRAVDGIADTIEDAICLAIKQALKQEAEHAE